MKKKILAVALAVVLIAVAGYSTLAYFTATDDATNVITAGTLTIQINEYQGTDTTPVAEETDGITITVIDAVPGDIISKIPKVENLLGNTDAWIRVKVTIECEDINQDALSITPISLDLDTTNWVSSGGWYYYTAIVPADTETSALFTEVEFDLATMDNTYQGAVVTITLVAEAVQSDNNGATYNAAAGWPTV